jgi:hypothetical protein
MTVYTIQYKIDPIDEWTYSCLNNDQSFPSFADAMLAMFFNAKKLVDKFNNIPFNDYRIVDNLGEQHVFYSSNEFRQLLEQFIQNSETTQHTDNAFEIET